MLNTSNVTFDSSDLICLIQIDVIVMNHGLQYCYRCFSTCVRMSGHLLNIFGGCVWLGMYNVQCCAQVAILKFKSSAVIRFEQHGTDYEPVNSCAATGLDKNKGSKDTNGSKETNESDESYESHKACSSFPRSRPFDEKSCQKANPTGFEHIMFL